MQQKDLRKLCGKLKEDRLLSVYAPSALNLSFYSAHFKGSHSRQETREGMQRPIHRDYYYIDFHTTIDAVKYRVWHLTQKVKDMYKPSEEKKEFFCPRCKAQWTQMEVLDKISYTGEFICHRCDGILERDEEAAADHAGHERQSKLMAQLDKLIKLLQQIDAETIPQNDFQTALSLAVPIKRDESINPTRQLQPVKPEPSTNLVVKTETVTPLEVSLLTDSASSEAERLAKERKAAQEKQNALPVWHTSSTINATITKPDPDASPKPASSLNPSSSSFTLKNEEEDKKNAAEITMNADLEAYYASLREEQERAALAGPSSSSDEAATDDEDDDEGFEDVEIGGSGVGASGINTPSSSMSGRPAANGMGRQGSGLKAESESSSALGTSAVGTPVDWEGSVAKKVKVDADAVLVGKGASAGLETEAQKEVDSDEDEEFEDAL